MAAIGSESVSRVVGYLLKKGDFRTVSPNLPQRVLIIGEANNANQGSLDSTETQVTSLRQAGELYGFGSPIYTKMRILRAISGDGMGGIPTYVIGVAAAGGAAAKILTVTPTGVATGNGTHYLNINGRNSIDGIPFAINVLNGDTAADITAKIEDAINSVLGSTVSASSDDYVATLTSKWRGLTANEINVTIDTNGDDLGLTYVVTSTQSASGTPSIASALAQLGSKWTTIIDSGFGAVSTIMDSLEDVNGIADPENPTGRYIGTIFKPFVSIIGSVAEDPSSLTDSRKDDMTIAFAPAPLSKGLSIEAASCATLLLARRLQDNPELGIQGLSYTDMPTPDDIGAMADYVERDRIVKLGCSTVDLISGKYQIQDFITTYHKDGEIPPQFRYVRDLAGVDWNTRYTYKLKEDLYVVDKVIANDDDITDIDNVIKPKMWKGVISDMSQELVLRGLHVDSAFTVESLEVGISTINPNRFETKFRYKRSGLALQSATEAEAGFNFGTLNAQ